MKRIYSAIVYITIFASLSLAAFAAAPGSQGDPVVSLSYVRDTFSKDFLSKAEGLVAARLSALSSEVDRRLSLYGSRVDAAGVSGRADAAYKKLDAQRKLDGLFPSRILSVKKGESLICGLGTTVTLLSGSARVSGAEMISLTSGKDAPSGEAVKPRERYMSCAASGQGFVMLADSSILADGYVKTSGAQGPKYTALAEVLKNLGLFKGSNNGFELERGATRLEALIMLVRLTGEEDAALACKLSHPFKDIPVWPGDQAGRFVAYAYSKGYTKGVSQTRFGSTDEVSADQFATFLLRAMGYSDGDFSWDKALSFASDRGILSLYEAEALKSGGFLRDNMVFMCCRALSSNVKAGGKTLLETLVSAGAVDKTAASSASDAITNAAF